MTFTKTFGARIAVFVAGCCAANPQGRPIDWPSLGNDAQRTGWEKVDSRITKDNVKDFKLALKRKLQNASGPHSITPPVVIGLLISYKGFKELGFVAGDSDKMWSIDLDLDRIFWQKQFETGGNAKGGSGPCAGGFATAAALIPPVNFGARPRPATPPAPGAAPGATPAAPVADTPRPGARAILGAGGFGAARPAFGVASDGKLHLMNTSTGDDVVPPMAFLPPHSGAASLTVSQNVVYATTSPGCGSGGVWAIDLSGPESQAPPVASFPLKGGSVSHHGGLALGADGTVYVQTGKGNVPESSNTVLALNAKDLKLKERFTAPGGLAEATPVVFAYKGRDFIVSAGVNGKLFLLDSKTLATPVDQTQPLCQSGCRIWGGLSSWSDADGTRWVLAPVWGTQGDASHGSIVAFKVEDKDGKTVLNRAWTSRDMSSPEPPVITTGVVFALSAGEYGNDERPKGSSHATLYALDAATGKELYSTGNQVTAPANLTGATLANGRVFFTTIDGTLWGFGVHMEI